MPDRDYKYEADLFRKTCKLIAERYLREDARRDECDEKISAYGEGRNTNPILYDNRCDAAGAAFALANLIWEISGCRPYEVDEVAKSWKEMA